MQDRPTAIELLQAAQEFCTRDLIPNLSGRVRFHARVLQNVLGILEREWEGEETAVRAEWSRLAMLLGKRAELPATNSAVAEDVRVWNTELAAAITSGDYDERWDEAVDAVYATVVEKLAIANPNYSSGAT